MLQSFLTLLRDTKLCLIKHPHLIGLSKLKIKELILDFVSKNEKEIETIYKKDFKPNSKLYFDRFSFSVIKTVSVILLFLTLIVL